MIRLILILVYLFSVSACAPQKNTPAPTSASTSTSTPATPTRPAQILPHPLEHLLLGTNDSETRRTDRANFLSQTPIQVIDREYLGAPKPAYLLNHQLINHQNFQVNGGADLSNHPYPASPVIHSYNYWASPIDFSAKLPDSFAVNLPNELKEAILGRPEIHSLEIYFTPQIDYFNGDYTNNDPALKAHYWVMPETPARFGELYYQNHPMMIYGADYPIDRHLRNHQWISANVNIHRNTYSPRGDIGGGLSFRLDTQTDSVQPVSFWSIVIDQFRHRAAVTLHWMLPDTHGLHQQFRTSLQNHGRQPEFSTVVEEWNAIPLLNNSPMMQKLRDLIQI